MAVRIRHASCRGVVWPQGYDHSMITAAVSLMCARENGDRNQEDSLSVQLTVYMVRVNRLKYHVSHNER